ncbi:DNA polymerase III subunit delta [Corynebacterium sp. TAE3-ERU12]|uniref:DNA polymerase III subunit delta n=1 Tax=Corynebacterium sp. TAE3-ERU12 TaxID=2849491 RepID=UPI001C446D4C|nr:DNA polymerase III subunit delta [Corynebacterium sp. TAE3-ERU12]
MSAHGAQPLNLILGDEGLLVERARNAIIADARAESGDTTGLDITTVHAANATTTELVNLLSPSLFGDSRVVVIDQWDNLGKDTYGPIIDVIGQPSPGITVIVEHSGKGRTSAALVKALRKFTPREFIAQAPKRNELPSFVQGEARRLGVRLSHDVVTTLLDAVGSDLRELATAMRQLASDTEGNITEEAIRTYYGASAEVTGFEVADLAVAGNVQQALGRLRRSMQLGTNQVLLASALTSAVGDISRLHAAARPGPADARTYGMPPWKLTKVHAVAQRWTTPMVASAVQVASRLDAEVKGEGHTPEFSLERAVIEIARIANSARR